MEPNDDKVWSGAVREFWNLDPEIQGLLEREIPIAVKAQFMGLESMYHELNIRCTELERRMKQLGVL